MISLTSSTEEIIEALETAHKDNLGVIDLAYLASAAIHEINEYRRMWLDACKEIDELTIELDELKTYHKTKLYSDRQL